MNPQPFFPALGLLAFLASSALAAPQLDPLGLPNAEMAAQINFRRMLQTPVVKKHALDALKVLLKRNEEVQQMLTAAGLDPLKDIDTISVSSAGGLPTTGSGKLCVVVRGTFDTQKAQKAADDYARKHPGRLKTFKEGEQPMWQITDDDKSLYAAFAGNQALVMSPAKEDTLAAIRQASQTPNRPSKAMQAALDHLKGDESLWLALVATDDVKNLLKNDDTAKDLAGALQSVTGALELTDDAQFALVVHTTSRQAAVQIKAKLDELMPLLAFVGAGKDKSGRIVKEVINSIKLKTEDNDVSIRLHITDAQIERARKQ